MYAFGSTCFATDAPAARGLYTRFAPLDRYAQGYKRPVNPIYSMDYAGITVPSKMEHVRVPAGRNRLCFDSRQLKELL